MTPAKRTVAIFTGNRAEYGLQYPVLRRIADDPRLDYKLLVSGAHLKEDFGRTSKEIEADGFRVHAEVRIDMPEDSLYATAQAIGSGILSVSRILESLRPDWLLVHADRFESFAALVAGTQMGIPTAHVEGGDYTEGGALDDSVRHAMTKLAHLHFATNEQAAERIRSLGEEPWRVYNAGLAVLDLVAAGRFAPPEEVYQRFGLDPKRPILVFTQHSVATEFEQAAAQVAPSLAALEAAAARWGCQVIITSPSDDAGGQRIVRELDRMRERGVPGVQFHRSVGRHAYHGLLNVAAAVLGNSSSGIKETPAFHVPCVNIGSRQRGRLRADNVIDTGYDVGQILEAIRRCLEDDAFRGQVRRCDNPYMRGGAGALISDVLATIEIGPALIQKKMAGAMGPELEAAR